MPLKEESGKSSQELSECFFNLPETLTLLADCSKSVKISKIGNSEIQITKQMHVQCHSVVSIDQKVRNLLYHIHGNTPVTT